MVVSSTTTLFQIRRKRNNTGTYYIKLLFITLLLGMLAYLASRNVVLCVLLNFTVPFALVFFQSDQFAPKGYFGYAMTFVFLELRPPTPEEFPVQMLCLLFCTLVLIGALLLYARLSAPSAPPEEEITRGLTRLAELLESGRLFVSDVKCGWMCLNCGHIQESLEAPKLCPVCSHDQGYFIRLEMAPYAAGLVGRR